MNFRQSIGATHIISKVKKRRDRTLAVGQMIGYHGIHIVTSGLSYPRELLKAEKRPSLSFAILFHPPALPYHFCCTACHLAQRTLIPMVCKEATTIVLQSANNVAPERRAITIELYCVSLHPVSSASLVNQRTKYTSIVASPSGCSAMFGTFTSVISYGRGLFCGYTPSALGSFDNITTY